MKPLVKQRAVTGSLFWKQTHTLISIVTRSGQGNLHCVWIFFFFFCLFTSSIFYEAQKRQKYEFCCGQRIYKIENADKENRWRNKISPIKETFLVLKHSRLTKYNSSKSWFFAFQIRDRTETAVKSIYNIVSIKLLIKMLFFMSHNPELN